MTSILKRWPRTHCRLAERPVSILQFTDLPASSTKNCSIIEIYLETIIGLQSFNYCFPMQRHRTLPRWEECGMSYTGELEAGVRLYIKQIKSPTMTARLTLVDSNLHNSWRWEILGDSVISYCLWYIGRWFFRFWNGMCHFVNIISPIVQNLFLQNNTGNLWISQHLQITRFPKPKSSVSSPT